MGKSAPSAPAPPSPQAVGQANQQTALWNASLADVNQNTPLGSITYNQMPGTGMTTNQQGYQSALDAYNAAHGATAPTRAAGENRQDYQQAMQEYRQGLRMKKPDIADYQTDTGVAPQFQSNVTLSPAMQQLLTQTQNNQNQLATTAGGLMGQIQEQASHPIDYSQFTPNPTTGDLNTISQNAQDAIMARLQPMFDQQNEQTQSDLLSKGISQGTQAWDNAMRPVNQSQNDARLQAVLDAGQEAQQMQGTALTSRDQQINEAYQQQQAPINQYGALMGNTQVQMPQFQAAPSSGLPGAPPGGNALEQNYAQQMQNYNAQLASQNQMTSGLFGLGGSLLMAPVTGGGSLFGNFIHGL